MQEIRTAKVNNRDVPILISDEKEALLAAKAAGRAIVGLWDSGHPEKDLSPAVYLVEKPEDADEEFLERVARRHLGLPWKICETKRTIVRELRGEDFMELWDNQVGLSFSSPEELEVYTKNQYAFYGFGFWGIVEKKSGELIGVAGLRVPEEADGKMVYGISWEDAPPDSAELELGYHICAVSPERLCKRGVQCHSFLCKRRSFRRPCHGEDRKRQSCVGICRRVPGNETRKLRKRLVKCLAYPIY